MGAKLAEIRDQRFICFVAASPVGERAPLAAAEAPTLLQRAGTGLLQGLLEALEMPEALDAWGTAHSAIGAVVFDTLGEHLPQRRALVDGSWTWLKRCDIAYVSNLCVARSVQRCAPWAALRHHILLSHPCCPHIDPSYPSRQGVGKLLLQRCEQEARALSSIAIALHVEPTNRVAVQLYQSVGFSVVRRGDGSAWEKLIGRSAADGLLLMIKPL